jgi:hypothetical protein
MESNHNWKYLLHYLATGRMPGEYRCYCDPCLDGEDCDGSQRVLRDGSR